MQFALFLPTFSVLLPLDLGHPAEPHQPRDDLLQLVGGQSGRLEPVHEAAASVTADLVEEEDVFATVGIEGAPAVVLGRPHLDAARSDRRRAPL